MDATDCLSEPDAMELISPKGGQRHATVRECET